MTIARARAIVLLIVLALVLVMVIAIIRSTDRLFWRAFAIFFLSLPQSWLMSPAVATATVAVAARLP